MSDFNETLIRHAIALYDARSRRRTEADFARATRATRFRLDVKRPGEPFVPHSFHETFNAACDEGLMAVTGQREEALEPPPGWDFIVRDAESRS